MLLAWTIAVFLLDVGTRRVAWDRFMSREFGTDLARRAREAVEDRSARASRTVSGLGARRERQREERQQVTPTTTSLSEADAVRLQMEAKRRRMQAYEQRMRDLREERRRERSGGAKPETPAQPEASGGDEEGPSGLLAAKRRAQKRFESPEDDDA
jgi:ABC-type multidrug transport system fused ATPase/permease subunit